jgi:hypothetical protein
LNIRGFGRSGRKQCIIDTIRKHDIDFIGIQETKTMNFHNNYLTSLASGKPFCWNWLPSVGSGGGS